MSLRALLAAALLAIMLAGIVGLVSLGRLPPAEFTFNNDTEIKSFDPAIVTGQPEGRIVESLYEGLVRLAPDDRRPIPGVAERWEVSEDGRTYTFHLRPDAEWSDGSPVTAGDFVYSMRRFLDPFTIAEYSYQAWYLKNARRYSQGARGVDVGDPVEVELHERPDGARPFARGEVVRGKLTEIELDNGATDEELADKAKYSSLRTFVVDTPDGERRFRVAEPGAPSADGVAPCRQVLLDFSEVGFRAPDDRTVVMTLDSPTAYWLQLVGFYPLAPVNQRCVETHGSPRWTEPENLVSNGPYVVEFHRLRDRIRLRKNPYYWNRDNVRLETIDALAVESLTTAFNLYETGQVDWVTKVTPLIAKELLKLDPPRSDFNPQPQFGTYFYCFNVNRPPLDDRRVRRALWLALDRDEIVRAACAGETPAYSITPPGVPGYDAPQGPRRDVEEARRLLAEAGYPKGEGFPKFELLYNTEDQHQTIAELIRKQWSRALRIDVATRNEEWTTYLSSQRNEKFDAIRRAWVGDYLDPNTFLDLFVTGGDNNHTGWGDSRYDELIHSAAAEVDPEKRFTMLREAEQILLADGPVMPVYYYVSRSLVRPSLRGWWHNPQDTHPLWGMWIDRSGRGPNEFQRSPRRNLAGLPGATETRRIGGPTGGVPAAEPGATGPEAP